MTRINCIPSSELTDKHLVAEYRELPRVFKLAAAYAARGSTKQLPTEYTLGKGHVMFFYDKLKWLMDRQMSLISEMQSRGFNPQYTQPERLLKYCPDHLFNDWSPTQQAQALNRQRIRERLDARKRT